MSLKLYAIPLELVGFVDSVNNTTINDKSETLWGFF